ncbi:RE1-silencing transcription factor A-like [Mercenaria mercenaria]|uniref:RE1-silencing transcription factor A-like n=1 Tax=Mercenaria mercenaria TaxID=6596 RepID=UPI00234E47D3|nr:RE1-silencing transcription factor A-like [Mercenaria mercenaria]XP_053379291.1 RE1-silencing transcription factor A-like [Mercenaria mercenaria]
MEYHYILSDPAMEAEVTKIQDTETALESVESDTTRKETVQIDEILNDGDIADVQSKVDDNVDAGEVVDLSKVKNEINEDDMYGMSTENEDYNLDTDTETEDTFSGDEITHSNKTTILAERDHKSIKQEMDKDTQVIVLNRHNKFNARPKPDPSTLRHECDKCEEAFQFPYQLARHKKIKHEGKYPYSCEICNKPFDRSSSLRDHMFVHTENRPFECKVCEKRFKMKGNLRKHIRDVHTEHKGPKLQFQCEYCSKIFPTKERLTSHFIVHDTEKHFACNVCGKKFNRKNNLKEHVVIHSTEKNFVCPDCGMRFNRKYSLKIHARNHMEVKPYKCELCPSSFSQLHALKTHFRLHTGEKPFKCTICEKTFRQLATLQVHFKRHTGVKDFKCGICGKGFVIKRRLIEHERLHTGEKPFSCDICPYRTATSSGLRLHKKTHVRQMERLGMYQVDNLLNGGSQSISPDGRKRKVPKKGKLPGLTVSTTFLKKKDVPVRKAESIDAIVGETNSNDNNDDKFENMDEEEVKYLSKNYLKDVETDPEEVSENLVNESLIEIVNDIADSENMSAELRADLENIPQNGIKNTIDSNDADNVEIAETQVSKIKEKCKTVKKASKVSYKKTDTKEIEFENVAKEVLYKHLNEFIPTIDADLLAEKIDQIAEELSDTRTKLNNRKPNSMNAKSKKNLKLKSDTENYSVTEDLPIDSGCYNGLLGDSAGTLFPQISGLDSSAGMFTFGKQSLCDKVPRKLAKCADTGKLPNTSTHVENNPHLSRQLLSNCNPVNNQQVLMPSAMAVTKRGGDLQNSVKEKPFLSSTLRNMLVSRRPDLTTGHTVTMTTQGSVVKKEVQPVSMSSASSSGVLRDMLSAPPKHYLISTKNSYAALQHSIKRQNEVSATKNGFEGKWFTQGSSGTDSAFPWVEEPEPSPPGQYDFTNIKVEPVSP